MKGVDALQEELGGVRKQGRVLVSGVTVLYIFHQLITFNQFTATDCESLLEILKLAACEDGGNTGRNYSAYKELLLCSTRYTAYIHTYI